MRRVLLVAYYFPPLGGIGSVRLASFATHLSDHGWEATVLAPRNGAYFRDASLEFPEARVIRTASLELSRAGKQILRAGGDDTSAAQVSGATALLRQLMRRYAYFPDAQVGWYPPAILAGRRHIRPGDFDAIFSSSFPVTAHLVARHLSRRLGLPWVAEFRDPWSAAMRESAVRTRAERLERAIAQEAATLVTVSPSWAEMFESAWNREVHVIRNGHDGGAARAAQRTSATFSLGYLGSYYPHIQDLGAIWSAVRALNSSADGPHVEKLRFIGELGSALNDELRMLDLTELVESTGFLPHDQALAELSGVSALLVAGPRSDSGVLKGHVVAKLSEYLATSRPIIYVGDPDADAAHLLAGFAGTHIVATGDVRAAIAALRAARHEQFDRDAKELERQSLTGRLAVLLDDVSRRS